MVSSALNSVLPMDTGSFFSIPRRVFLDTNVVNMILDHADFIHENSPLPDDLRHNVRREVESLAGIFDTGRRALWQFAVSPLTYREVSATNDPLRRARLESWFAELWFCWRGTVRAGDNRSAFIEAEEVREALLSSGILNILPDASDRALLVDAMVYRCDCFCTVDNRTILKHRDALQHLSIDILTPSEWWARIRPWAAIWL